MLTYIYACVKEEMKTNVCEGMQGQGGLYGRPLGAYRRLVFLLTGTDAHVQQQVVHGFVETRSGG